jgi:hypothetical protein
MKRFVLVHKEAGVYLGSCMGLGFWSQWDAVGQDHAVAFASQKEAEDYAASWDKPMAGLSTIAVETTDAHYASVNECVAAGLPAWNP